MNSYTQLMILTSVVLFISGISFYDDDSAFWYSGNRKKRTPPAYIVAMRKASVRFSVVPLVSGFISLLGSAPWVGIASFVILLAGALLFFIDAIRINKRFRE